MGFKNFFIKWLIIKVCIKKLKKNNKNILEAI